MSSAKTPKEEIRKGDELSAEQLAQLKPIEITPVYAGTFNVQGTGNDFTILFQRLRPLVDRNGALVPGVGVSEVVSVVTMSPQALKDLSFLLAGQIENHEKEYGEIETDYTRRLKSKK